MEEKASDRIGFYGVRGRFGAFSNFARAPFGVFATSEHCFQALKFVSTDVLWAAKICSAKTPSEAAKNGRSHQPIDPKWDEIRIEVMHSALHLKFDHHPAMKQLLMGTGNALLVEESPTDSFWGSGKDGKGLNHLGEELMALRTYYASGAVDVSHSHCSRCMAPDIVKRFAVARDFFPKKQSTLKKKKASSS